MVQPLGRTGLAKDRSQCLPHLSGAQLWMTGQVEDREAGSQSSGTPGQLESMQAGHLHIGHKGVTPDGQFSLEEVECIGACSWGPAIQVNYDFHDELTPDHVPGILDQYRGDAKTEGKK